jgi:MFS family permease
LPPHYRRYLLGVGIAGLGDFSNTLLILWATEAFRQSLGLEEAITWAMLFYVGYNVVYTISCYTSGALADILPKKWILSAGYALAIIPASALMIPGDSFLKFGIVFGFSGLYMGVWETVESATAASMLPAPIRGIGFGILATVNGIGDLVSSIVVGLLWIISPVLAMLFVIVASLAGASIIASLHPSNPIGSGDMTAADKSAW